MGQDDIDYDRRIKEQAVLLPPYTPKTRREHEEEHTPLWVKIFGGSILSIAFLSVITLIGYIVANLNSIQTQINTVNSEMITKKEFTERQKGVWDGQKACNDSLGSAKERLNAIEQLAKEPRYYYPPVYPVYPRPYYQYQYQFQTWPYPYYQYQYRYVWPW